MKTDKVVKSLIMTPRVIQQQLAKVRLPPDITRKQLSKLNAEIARGALWRLRSIW